MGKIQFQGLLPLMIFCALIIAGLCFGQYVKSDIESSHAELVSASHSLPGFQPASRIVSTSHIGQYVKPLSQWDRLTMSNLQARIPQFFNTMLMMQVEGESLKPKTSFWKQAGIYGLEFAGAGIGTALPSYYSVIIIATNFMDNPQDSAVLKPTLCFYALGNILLGSSSTWVTGKILGQDGSWWKSAIGTGIGSALGILAYNRPGCDDWRLISIFLITPPLGAVIGYNWQ
jgi:hypothetical protein